jgi:hypothetical protein
MTLTIAMAADTIPLSTIDDVITNYTSIWPINPSNTQAILSQVPSGSATQTPPTRPPQHRWRRNSKENYRRRKRIKRGNRAVFWLPNGTFPGGWFFGMPDFSKWENVTVTNTTDGTDDTGMLGKPLSTQEVTATVSGGQEMNIFVEDSVDRGAGYLAGYGPTPLGQFPPVSREEQKVERQQSPLFGFVSLMMLKEVSDSDDFLLLCC